MANEGSTWLENRKLQIAEQKSLFRDGKSIELAHDMLDMGRHNFAVRERTAKICSVLELVSQFFQRNENTAEYWRWMDQIPVVVKTYQLGVGEGTYRQQAIDCVVPKQIEPLGGVKL